MYSDISEIKNYSTIPHELGHTFNLNHVWKHDGSCGNVDYDPEGDECFMTGDLICDTEAAPCVGFEWNRSNSWKNEDGQIYCSFVGQGSMITLLHDCGTVPNDQLRSRMVDNLTGNYIALGHWEDIRNMNNNISDDLSLFINPVLQSETNNWDAYIYETHDSLGNTYGTRELDLFWNEDCQEWIIDDYWNSIEEDEFHPSPIQNFLANGAVSHCRNLGCSEIDPLCTPIEGFTPQQLSSARFDIEYYLFGCNDPGALNFDPNVVVNDGSCEYATIEISIDFISDWNLVGLPLGVEDASYLTLFPDALENTLFLFDDAYFPDTIMIEGEGYWLRFANAGISTIIGDPISQLSFNLSEGWNLISGISEEVSMNAISDPEGIIVPGTLYGFNGGYVEMDMIDPGKGYWIRANSLGSIILTGN